MSAMSQKKYLLTVMVVLMLLGCSSPDTSDLEQYVDSVKSQTQVKVDPLPELPSYEHFNYQARELRNPFQARKVIRPKLENGIGPNGIKPDDGRVKEPLEAYPLDSLQMVGFLSRGEQFWALVRSPSSVIYRVQMGNYLGQNHGQIIAINENQIVLKEIVADALNGWTEREATLGVPVSSP